MDMLTKLTKLLESIGETESELMNRVWKYHDIIITESLSTDDANAVMVGNRAEHHGLGKGLQKSSTLNSYETNEYFEDDNLEPLDSETLDMVKRSQLGRHRITKLSPRGRDSSVNDPMGSGHSVIGTSGGGDGAYAGSSGGYNLGGPA